MHLPKRSVWITCGIMALVVLGAVAAFWIGLNRSYRAPSPMRCLPATTHLVLRLADRSLYDEQRNDLAGRDDLLRALGGEPVRNLALRLDSLFREPRIQQPALGERDIYVAFNAAHDSTELLTAAFCLQSRMEWHRALQALRTDPDIQVGDTTIGGHGLVTLRQTGYDGALFLAAGGGCLFASEHPDVLLTFGSEAPTMRDDQAFCTIERTASQQAPFTLYINTRTPDARNPAALDKRNPLRAVLAAPIVRAILRGALPSDWLTTDLTPTDEGLAADGLLVGPHPSLDILQAREATAPLAIAHRIPRDVMGFTRVAPGRRGLASAAFCENLALQPDSVQTRYREQQAELLRLTGSDVEGLLAQAFSAEAAYGYYGPGVADGAFTVVSGISGATTQAALTAAITALHRGEPPQQITTIAAGEGAVPEGVLARRADAQQIGSAQLPVFGAFHQADNLFFLDLLFGLKPAFKLFFRYEDTIVLANDQATLRRVLSDYIRGNTLDADPQYLALREHFASESYRFSFRRTPPGSSFGALGKQLTVAGRLPYLSLYASEANAGAKGGPAWTVRLDTAIVAGPWAVRNHYSQLSECLVQDETGRLNLIGADGMLLWKRAVDGRIIGNVEQVDFYANGKLQYLFATESSLYIVDRLGNDVATFPIHLPSPAVAGASHALYADGSPLRLFVPTLSGALLYGPDAARVEGFKPQPTEGDLAGPAQHLVCGSKDYIVLYDKYTYYFLDRRGARRLSASPVAPGPGSPITLDNTQESFIGISADGSLFAVREASGAVEHFLPEGLESLDIGAPFGAQYLAVGKGKAVVYDLNGHEPTVVSSLATGMGRAQQVATLVPYFALQDEAAEVAHVFTPDGEASGSPIASSARVALGEGLKCVVAYTLGPRGEVLQWRFDQ